MPLAAKRVPWGSKDLLRAKEQAEGACLCVNARRQAAAFMNSSGWGAAYVPLAPVALMAAARCGVIMQQSNNPWDRVRFEVVIDG